MSGNEVAPKKVDYQESFQKILDSSLAVDPNETQYYDAAPTLPSDIEFDEEGGAKNELDGVGQMRRQTSTSSSVSSAVAAETGMPSLALSPITPGSANPNPRARNRPLTPVTPTDGDRPSLSKCQKELKQSINKIEKVVNTSEREDVLLEAEIADFPVEKQLKRALKQNKKLLKERKEILLLLGQTGKTFATYEQESTRRREKIQSDLDSSIDNNAVLTQALETNNAALDSATHELAMLQDLYTNNAIKTDMGAKRIKQLELDLNKKEAEIEAKEHEIAALRKTKSPQSEPVEVKDHQDTEVASMKNRSKRAEETEGLLAKNEAIDLDPDDDMLQVNWFLRLCCAHPKMIKAPKITSTGSLATLPTAESG
mmetsp:Transcript_29963/g.71270  ORF Transcript_29963/g.71270 Transcript_29963/m.71270 type:complete len:370 (+) Transcript_29963:195-1304(+)